MNWFTASFLNDFGLGHSGRQAIRTLTSFDALFSKEARLTVFGYLP